MKVWSSKLLAIAWLKNIINAIYVHFWVPKIKTEFLWNPIREKYSQRWCTWNYVNYKLEVISRKKFPEKQDNYCLTIQKTLKSLSGHTRERLTGFPHYGHKKKRKVMVLPYAAFLYGRLWCIVRCACQDNPGILLSNQN